jgi:hypothetical protein
LRRCEVSNRESLENYSTIERLRKTLTDDELAHIVRRRQEQFKQDPEADPVYSASDLLKKQLPPVKWAIPDVLPEGLTLLGGKPKMGKSWLALGIGVAVATGGVALGSKRVELGDVFYLALEDNERRMQGRLKTILRAEECENEADLTRLHITHTCPRIGQGAEEYIRSWLMEHPYARLVIVDVLKKIRPTHKRGGNSYDDDYSDVEPLQKLASEFGVAFLVLTHLRKASADDPLDTLNATLGLSGAADNVIAIMRERGKADAVMVGAGRDLIELDLALRWDELTASWSILGDAEEYRLSTERKEMLDVMHSFGKAVRPRDLYPLLPEKTESAIRGLLFKMSRSNDVLLGESGKYCINTSKHPNYGAMA